MVFDGEMRHWTRTLLAFTRPYLGTARSMSKTFAVSRYDGGFMSSWWIDTLPAFRSRLSCARAVRILLARSSASIRWFNERSGAAEGFAGVFVADGTAGEDTGSRGRGKTKPQYSPEPRPELDASSVWSSVLRLFAGLFGLSTSARERSRERIHGVCGIFTQLPGDSDARRRVAEALGAHGDQRCPGSQQVTCVRAALDPSHTHNRDRNARCDGGDLRERDVADRRPAEAAGAAAQPGLAGGSERHRPQR